MVCSQPVTRGGRKTRVGMFLHDIELLWPATLAWGLIFGIAKIFLELQCNLRPSSVSSLLPSFFPSPSDLKSASQSDDSPNLFPIFSHQCLWVKYPNTFFVHLILSWNLLLGRPELMQEEILEHTCSLMGMIQGWGGKGNMLKEEGIITDDKSLSIWDGMQVFRWRYPKSPILKGRQAKPRW